MFYPDSKKRNNVSTSVILIFSSSLVLAIQENIVYKNDEDIDFYYGLAVFKNNEKSDGIDRITHQFVTPAHFPKEYSSPKNALLALNEQLLFDLDVRSDPSTGVIRYTIKYNSFTINPT